MSDPRVAWVAEFEGLVHAGLRSTFAATRETCRSPKSDADELEDLQSRKWLNPMRAP
jgi:hypothetical protein